MERSEIDFVEESVGLVERPKEGTNEGTKGKEKYESSVVPSVWPGEWEILVLFIEMGRTRGKESLGEKVESENSGEHDIFSQLK